MKENNKDKKEINNKLNRNRKNKKIAYQSDLESLQEVGSDSGEEELVKTKEKIFPNRKYNLNKTIRELENINSNKIQNESLMNMNLKKILLPKYLLKKEKLNMILK